MFNEAGKLEFGCPSKFERTSTETANELKFTRVHKNIDNPKQILKNTTVPNIKTNQDNPSQSKLINNLPYHERLKRYMQI